MVAGALRKMRKAREGPFAAKKSAPKMKDLRAEDEKIEIGVMRGVSKTSNRQRSASRRDRVREGECESAPIRRAASLSAWIA